MPDHGLERRKPFHLALDLRCDTTLLPCGRDTLGILHGLFVRRCRQKQACPRQDFPQGPCMFDIFLRKAALLNICLAADGGDTGLGWPLHGTMGQIANLPNPRLITGAFCIGRRT